MGTPSCSEGRAKGVVDGWMGMEMGTRTREQEEGSSSRGPDGVMRKAANHHDHQGGRG